MTARTPARPVDTPPVTPELDASVRAPLLRNVGLAVLGLLVLVTLVRFTVPATIALADRFTPFSEQNVVRMYLLWPLVVGAVALFALLATTRRDQPRRALLSGLLLLDAVVLVGVLILDRRNFTAEVNSITWFTSVVLLAAAAAAFQNVRLIAPDGRRNRTWRFVWGLLALAFAGAALDEALGLHEAAGSVIDRLLGRPEATDASPAGVAQDFITIAYATAAVVVGGFVVWLRRSGWIERGRIFHLVGLAAIGIYAVAVSLDNVDKLLVGQSTSVDLVYGANALEEVLEFTAAVLFLASGLVAIVERRRLIGARDAGTGRWSPLPFRAGRPAALAALLGILALAVALPIVVRVPAGIIAEMDRYTVVEVRGAAGGALNPDGLRFVDGTLYVADDVDAVVLAHDGRTSRQLAGPANGLVRPEAVALAPDGSIFVSDDISNQLSVIRPDGRVEVLAGPTTGLLGPRGLVTGPDGSLYISDRVGVSVVRWDGQALSLVAGAIEGITEPEELAIDDQGRLYVAEEGIGRVLRIGASGQAEVFVDETNGILSPEGIAWADGYLYVADAAVGAVFRFDEAGNGEQIVSFAPRFRRVEGLTVADEGRLYVGIRRDAPLASMVLELIPITAGS